MKGSEAKESVDENKDVEERYRHLRNLVFGEVPGPSEKVKGRELRPKTPLDSMRYVLVSSDDLIFMEVVNGRYVLWEDGESLG